MKIFRTNAELDSWLQENHHPAFVPTMGYLHDAHLALIKRAIETKKPVLVSIFVNPKQFAPGEDLDVYPRDEEGDIKKIREIGADAVFLPSIEEVYPEGRDLEVPKLPKIFSEIEGKIRPGFFEGITKVLRVFFEKIKPSIVVFGQKDYQQTLLVKWMVKYFEYPIEVIIHPIIREKDGLAMSSRNAYLSAEERKSAVRISKGVSLTKQKFLEGKKNPRVLEDFLRNFLKEDPLTSQVDFLEIRDAESLGKIEVIKKTAVLLVYVKMKIPRLLDNVILE